ncbi:MAG TPA: response regulator [Bryobacteraceae bacterium]|nr:response regulator [Bryobacteraceae bacterium]
MANAPGRILLVDDEPSLLKMMQMYLRRMGHEVTVASTTEQAWAQIQAASDGFSGVVLDATMDGMSMDELARRILSADPQVFVIAASGYPMDMSSLESSAPGRVLFLHKPFAPETLAGTIRRMLAAQEEKL